MPRRRLAALGIAAALAIGAAACTDTTPGDGAPGRIPPVGSSAPGPTDTERDQSDNPSSCPSAPIAPDARRPVTTLTFDVAPGLTSVQGTETVRFTPDLPVDELVFRLTPNTAPSVEQGNRIEVTSASADPGGGAPRYEAADAAASTQGGLLIIPLADTVAAGTTITARVAFTLTLGLNSFDRVGRAQDYAWFASAHPLLAWERGFGWHTEPLLQFTAESATSEAADTDLTVTAPASMSVLMSGNPSRGEPAGDMLRWHSSLEAARDVSVSVGPFVLADASVPSSGAPVDLRVGAPTRQSADALVEEFERALSALSRLLGPYPFPSLSVARLPGSGGGIEYPGSILMMDSSTLVAVHETAHQWFYAMVGNSQAQHAWLDEAFASWAEQVVDDDPPPSSTLEQIGVVDTPTADYGGNEGAYYSTTYDKGAAALHAARAAVGAAEFDAAIRCYVNANAWTIADPQDVADALAELPGAIEVLEEAGALR